MNEKECLLTRCLLSRIIDTPPDNISVIKLDDNENVLFLVPYINDYEFGISFNSVPTKEDILIIIDEFKEVSQEWMEEDECEDECEDEEDYL